MGHTEGRSIEWKCRGLVLVVDIDANEIPRITALTPAGSSPRPFASPWFDSPSLGITSVKAAGEGNTSIKTAKSLIGGYLSDRMRYESHRQSTQGTTQTLDIVTLDRDSRLEITHHFTAFGDVPVLRCSATMRNLSATPLHISQISSIVLGGLTSSSQHWWEDYTISFARNGWFREAMWQTQTLSEAGIDDHHLFELREGHEASQATFSISNRGSFSTGKYLPMGLLQHRGGKDTWLWQIESSGSWRWEIGDFHDSVYLTAGGPNGYDHDWKMELSPGASFVAIGVACCHIEGSADDAFAAMSDYRRHITRRHPDNEALPIIFNDYMNCLMGDPTEDKIKALIEPVARSGAEYFVIDAGWYADDSNWWDDVGLWEPSLKRFPSGFGSLMQTIRDKGLVPGLWLEPEVIGIKSVVAKQLPELAFFQQSGKRVVERGRFQLDYRHPAVRERMHGVIERLVTAYGVGYFKFDYNIEVLSGNDAEGQSSGVAHLEHQRAYLAWLSELLDKFPNLVIENCSSGGQRMEYAMLSVCALQSTSDQQVPEAYAAIAAAVPTAVLPEQSASWAYPQAGWSDEMNALTVVNSMLGRVHLSGRLDQLEPHQYDIVKTGMDVYKSIRHLLRTARPFWPLGLPEWHADWLALCMICPDDGALIAVWRRKGSLDCVLHLPPSIIAERVELLYPLFSGTSCTVKAGNVVQISVPATVCGRLFRVTGRDRIAQ